MSDILTANIRKIDIGTLIALQKLLVQCNLSKVAREVGLSQPALSHTLAKLRHVFDDRLLVRDGGGFVLTAQGEALRDRLEQVLPPMLALFEKEAFDPARASTLFKLGMTDHAGLVVLPSMQEALLDLAPHIRTSIALIPNWQTDQSELDAGRYDLRIGGLRSLPPQWHQRKLLNDRIVLICANSNKDIGDYLTEEQLVSLDHLGLGSDRPAYPNPIDDFLSKRGLERRVVMRVSHFSIAPNIIAKTRLVATCPETVALSFGESIRIVELPFRFPDIDLSMAWHPRVHAAVEHIWLRRLIVDCTRQARAEVA